jgi:L-ascorbate metabolism protein UlaG (beta-lactamase superfamily)
MNACIQFRCNPNRLLKGLGWLILCLTVSVATIACSTPRSVIKNESLNDWDGRRMRYKNLFPPNYSLGETTAYDRIDYLKPHERKPYNYRLLADPRGGDIDRTLGYDPAAYSVQPDFNRLQSPTHDVQITWIRHASFLIQLGGNYHILVDPVLEQWDGLAGRLSKYTAIEAVNAKSALAVEDLSSVFISENPDGNATVIVAISHDHLDHLNFRTLEKLPESTRFYVPHGVENKFSSRFLNVIGMDWYTQDTTGGLTIHFLPANHGSGIYSNEVDKNLWGGWLIDWKGHRVYFAGDTGYSDLFKDIRQRFGKMDVCLMPIAAWYWRHRHFAPEDAVQAAEDLGCKTFVPWGWGTWIMSYEHMLEPPRRLQYAWDQMQPENMELRILRMGETYFLE